MDNSAGVIFKHFLITRFNLRIEKFSSCDKNREPVLTEKWLETRFYLFEKYCLPSIMNQSCQNFIWLVLFDSGTPERFKKQIKEAELKYPLIRSLFLDSGDSETVIKVFNDFLAKSTAADIKYVITTRIDNDDAFHQDMIADVQKQFDLQEDRFISFPYGFQYDLNKKVLARMYYRNNHFISKIEKKSPHVNTVIAYDHTYIDCVGEVTYLEFKAKPMWIEFIHESNIVNTLSVESIPVYNLSVLRPFNLQVGISFFNTILAGLKHFRMKFYRIRASILKMLGIYDFLKRLTRKV